MRIMNFTCMQGHWVHNHFCYPSGSRMRRVNFLARRFGKKILSDIFWMIITIFPDGSPYLYSILPFIKQNRFGIIQKKFRGSLGYSKITITFIFILKFNNRPATFFCVFRVFCFVFFRYFILYFSNEKE